jgi:histidine ammonia-lyase
MSMQSFEICITRKFFLKHVSDLIENPERKIAISDAARASIEKCHAYILKKMSSGSEVIYGINTGFGFLCDKVIPHEDLAQLQVNLIRSHACGTGREVRPEIVRLMLLLKVRALCMGHSGVSLATVERLIEFYNQGIVPVVYEQGSLGASGDLAPLAHLFLPFIGEGEVDFQGKRISGAELHKTLGWQPLSPGPKEGLALLNGTQFMLAHAAYLVHHSLRLMWAADVVTSLSLEGFHGRADAFDPLVHKIRPHKGQVDCAKIIFELLGGEEAVARPRKQVQDPYSFRCVPQVHGASRDAVAYAAAVVETEINSVSDNPLVFPDEDRVISGGNFHGQPLAVALDLLAIALAELGSISERRTFLLMSGVNELPLFLCKNPGLHSGLMIIQYTAAALASQNKQLCTPAVVDSITSSNGQEDHVSMGANGAVKCVQVLENVFSILGIELISASQAVWLRNETLNENLQPILQAFQKEVPPVNEDQVMSPLIERAGRFVKQTNFY